uniref:hypothetical protein n=1 Tax=Burkholderia arboris TaxID=488730 RepID=UPI001F33C67F
MAAYRFDQFSFGVRRAQPCDEFRAVVHAAHRHDGGVDQRVRGQYRLDFTGLDAQATQLDLVIDAAEEFDV